MFKRDIYSNIDKYPTEKKTLHEVRKFIINIILLVPQYKGVT